MKKVTLYTLVLLSLSVLIRCSQSPTPSSPNFMMFDDVEYVTEFPQSFNLSNKTVPDIDVIGITNFTIYYSKIIFSTRKTDSLLPVFTLPQYKYRGSLLSKGNGPFEFMQSPSVGSSTKFFKENDELFAAIYDFQKGRVLKVNIDKSLTTNKLDISILNDSLSPFLFNFMMIEDDKFFCKEVHNNETQQIRYIIEGNRKSTPAVFEKLNQATIKEREDVNILSTITKMNYDNDIIVEVPIGLNYINMYTLDGAFSKTVCIGDKMDNIEKIQNKDRWDRIYTFADLRLFENFWGVIHIDEDEKTYQLGRKKLPLIYLFDWQGKPIAELKLDHFITSFDIDLKNGSLYTFDVHSDELYRYDVKGILSKVI